MMNPFRKWYQNWKGVKGEEPTPLIVAESKRSYLWLVFLIIWPIIGFFVLLAWNPFEGMAADSVGEDWVLYLIFMFMAAFPYPIYRVLKDTIYTKTTQVVYQLDRTTMADPDVKGTITVGLNPEKEISVENPTSFMITLDLRQRGGFKEFGIPGDAEDGFIGHPQGTFLNFGHTKVINAFAHRYLIGDIPEPLKSQIKNKTLMKDHHFIDLGFKPIFLTIKPEKTGEAIRMMEENWQVFMMTKEHLKTNGKDKDLMESVELGIDNMLLLKDILMNAEAGVSRFNADWLIKEQSDEIKKWKADRDDLFEQLRNMRQGPETQQPPPGGQE